MDNENEKVVMGENENIYALFNLVNEGSWIITTINTLVSGLFGASIVYYFNIRLEKRKQIENQKQEFENLKNTFLESIEEYRMIMSYISEYRSKSEYQIKRFHAGLDWNEKLYNVRVAKFDDFRIKLSSIRARLLSDLKIIENNSDNKLIVNECYKLILNYVIPDSVQENEINLYNEQGQVVLAESDIDKMVFEKLSNENQLYWIINQIEEKLENIKFKQNINS